MGEKLINNRYTPNQEIGERFWELLEGHRDELTMMGPPAPNYNFLAARFMEMNPHAQPLLNKVQDETRERMLKKNSKIDMPTVECYISWAIMSASRGDYTLADYNRKSGTNLSERRLEDSLVQLAML